MKMSTMKWKLYGYELIFQVILNKMNGNSHCVNENIFSVHFGTFTVLCGWKFRNHPQRCHCTQKIEYSHFTHAKPQNDTWFLLGRSLKWTSSPSTKTVWDCYTMEFSDVWNLMKIEYEKFSVDKTPFEIQTVLFGCGCGYPKTYWNIWWNVEIEFAG